MNDKIYTKAIEHWGKEAQIAASSEELAELIVVLQKYLNNKCEVVDIVDELADVSIMLNQLIIMFECKLSFDERVRFKLDRLSKLLE